MTVCELNVASISIFDEEALRFFSSGDAGETGGATPRRRSGDEGEVEEEIDDGFSRSSFNKIPITWRVITL